MKKGFLFLFLISSFVSCEYFKEKPTGDAVARVKDSYLYKKDIEKVIVTGSTPEDSLLFVNNYINQWATRMLLIDRAQVNLSSDDLERFEKLVQEYRNDLLTEAYKSVIITKQLDTTISHEAYEDYYEENKESFRLNDVLLKMRYVFLPPDYEGDKDIQEKLKRFKEEDQEYLADQSYSFISSNLNDSIWIKKDNVFSVLPILRDHPEAFNKGSFSHISDSLGIYLVKIEDRLNLNEVAPLSHVRPTLKQILLNKRKLELIKKFERDLAKDAMEQNKFEIYTYE